MILRDKYAHIYSSGLIIIIIGEKPDFRDEEKTMKMKLSSGDQTKSLKLTSCLTTHLLKCRIISGRRLSPAERHENQDVDAGLCL